jgi:hypothetical protein
VQQVIKTFVAVIAGRESPLFKADDVRPSLELVDECCEKSRPLPFNMRSHEKRWVRK